MNRRRPPRRPSGTNTAPHRPPARRRWPPRPRSSRRNSTQWKAAGDRLREILDEWRTISGLDRKTDDALWKRYSAARETFNRRRGSHFAELDRERAGARQAKEALCERAEELADSTDWGPTACGVPRPADRVEGRRAAPPRTSTTRCGSGSRPPRTPSSPARNAVHAERDAEFRANADAKEALLAEAEKLDTSDLDAARAALRTIGDKWDAIGKVPRERSADLERRLRAVEKKVRDAPSHGVDPEAQARADQFRDRAEQFERQAEKAAAAGRTKDAEEARASAEQWRQWADAAAEALGKELGVSSVCSSGSAAGRRSRLSSSPLFCRLAAARRRSSSAASCSAVRAHTTRAQLNVSTITAIHAMISPMPGPGMRCAGAVWRDHTASSP